MCLLLSYFQVISHISGFSGETYYLYSSRVSRQQKLGSTIKKSPVERFRQIWQWPLEGLSPINRKKMPEKMVGPTGKGKSEPHSSEVTGVVSNCCSAVK